MTAMLGWELGCAMRKHDRHRDRGRSRGRLVGSRLLLLAAQISAAQNGAGPQAGLLQHLTAIQTTHLQILRFRFQLFSPLRSKGNSRFSLRISSMVTPLRRVAASRPSVAVSASSTACCTLRLSQRLATMFS